MPERARGAVRVAAVFPGQGAQHTAMGAALRACSAQAREAFEEASDALGWDVAALCDEQPAQRLNQTELAQPALLTCSVAAYRALQAELGMEPVVGAGHSLGELSALVCAESMTLVDAVRLVQARGRLMQQAAPLGAGGMAAVFGLAAEEVARICAALEGEGARVWVANYNAAEQTVISGQAEAVAAACDRLDAAGGVAHTLAVSIPAHTPLMAQAADRFAAELAPIELRNSRWPVLCNRTVEPHGAADAIKHDLVLQLTQPVQWRRTMAALAGFEVDAIVEVGPKTVLRDLFKLEMPGQVCFAVGEPDGLDALRRFASAPRPDQAAAALEWDGFLGRCLAIAVATRNDNEDPAKHAVAVVEPYRMLQAMRYEQWESGEAPGPAQIRRAADLLRRILRGKRVPEGERAARLSRLIEETRTAALLPDFDA